MDKRLLAVVLLAVPALAGCGTGKSLQHAGSGPGADRILVTFDTQPYAAFRRSVVRLTGTVSPRDATVVVDGINAAVSNGRWRTRVERESLGRNSIQIIASRPGMADATASTVLIRKRSQAELAALRARRRAAALERERAAASLRAAARRAAQEAPPTPAGGGGPYPAAVRADFLRSCENQLYATASGCECALQYIEDRVPLTGLEAAEHAIVTGGTIPRWLYDAAAACE